MPMHAVLTGDIVNSTKMDPATEKKLVRKLQKVLAPFQFEFYRGDSFQVYMKDAEQSLWLALMCRVIAIRMNHPDGIHPADIRIGIGLGHVVGRVRTLGAAKGEAFVLSGRIFDELQQTDTRLSIITGQNSIANIGLEVMADYINTIYREMTDKQAEVIIELLKGLTQQKVSTLLHKSKSTISQLVNSARWPEIEKILRQYKTLIKQLA